VVFNIAMGNFGDSLGNESFDPMIEYMRGTLSTCGHEVAVTWNSFRQDAINLIFEFFLDTALVDTMSFLRRTSTIKFGIVTTDLIVASSFPDAKYSMPTHDIARKRIAGFEASARKADFVWSWLRRTADEARRHNPISEFFPVGHVAEVPEDLRRSPKDIDVVFLGMCTPHRARILDALRARGITVVCVGPGFPADYRSQQMLDSLLDRAKIGLNLSLDRERANGIDPRFASCLRIVRLLERGTCVLSEEIPLDNPYRAYMRSVEPDAIAQACFALLSADHWRNVGQKSAERFRHEMDVSIVCAPVVARTLAAVT
jgi:hypothetical protein